MVKKEESLIHLKFGHSEAINAKKDILSSEINLLKAAQIINVYEKLRLKELGLKDSIVKKSKSIKSDITKLEKILPKIKIPKILQKEHKRTQEIEKVGINPQIKTYGTIEDQLLDIQKRLKLLSKTN